MGRSTTDGPKPSRNDSYSREKPPGEPVRRQGAAHWLKFQPLTPSLAAAGRPELGCHGAEFDHAKVVDHRPLTEWAVRVTVSGGTEHAFPVALHAHQRDA